MKPILIDKSKKQHWKGLGPTKKEWRTFLSFFGGVVGIIAVVVLFMEVCGC